VKLLGQVTQSVYLIFGVMLFGCGKPAEGPNVILIVADTLRADHLRCYGYDRETSPNLDAFASGATLYESAISAASYTLPAHASMFTGQLPMTHMAQTYLNSDGFRFEKGDLVHRPLSEDFITLAEAFEDLRYRTAGFAANTVLLSKRTGLTQGFDYYFNERGNGAEINAEVLPWIEKYGRKPFFLFLNYMDTHEVYNTEKVEGFLEHASGNRVAAPILDELYPIIMKEQEPPADVLQRQVDVYDLSIRNLDKYMGELIAKLRELDLYNNTMIIFTSDHGEFLGEHHYMTHWKDVYQEVLHVPLIIKEPGQHESLRIVEKISTVNIPRLIMDAIQHEELAAYRPSFTPVIRQDAVLAESRFSHEKDYYDPDWGHRFKRVRTALYEGDFKFIHSTDGKHEMYDLAADPKEQNNIIAAQPELAERLRAEVETMISKAPEPPIITKGKGEAEVLQDREELQDLKDLGYL